MALRFSVYPHIQQLPENWNTPFSAKSSLAKAEIAVQDSAKIENLKSLYLTASEDNIVVFRAYFQLLYVKPLHFNLGEKKQQQFWLNLALNIVKPTLLVAGNLFRHDEVFFEFASDFSAAPEKKYALYKEAVDYLIKYTNASGIFLKDVPEVFAEYLHKDSSYTPMQDDISMEIDLLAHWNTLNDYEKELKHKYLQRYRKIRNAFVSVEIKEFDQAGIEKYHKEIFELYKQVTQKQIVSMGMLNEYFFTELKKAMGEKYKVFGFFHEEKLIAFSSAIVHDTIYDMNYIGIDYKHNQAFQLYFNILFHCLQSAMDTGSQKLVLGRTALEAKAILGCKPDYRYSFYKLRNVIVNWFFQRVSKYFSEQQGEKWKTRHPFKSSFYNPGKD